MQPSRRGIFLALAGIGLFLLSGGWISMGGILADAPVRYVEATVGEPQRINPLAIHANDTEADLVALLFSGLTRITGDGTPVLDLAESWEVTPDGLTHTFQLRRDAIWHDGAPFTAHDVAHTIELIQADDFDGPLSLAAEWRGVDVFVDDAWTVLIRLPEPAADFLVRASVGLLPVHLEDAQVVLSDGARFDRAPVGTGPYRLTSLRDDRAVLDRNVDYIHGVPGIPQIELRFAEHPLHQLEMLEDGVADAALLGEQPNDLETMVLAEREDLTTTLLPRSAYTVLYLNTRVSPLTEAPTRRALAASIDAAVALETAGAARYVPGEGVIVPGSWAFHPDIVDGEPGTVETRWLAAGWVRGDDGTLRRAGTPLELELVTNNDPFRERLAETIAEQLRAAGVAVTVTVATAGQVISEYLRAGDFQMVLFGWEAGIDPDPYAGWHASQIGGVGGNVAAFRDVESDALLEAARTTLDVGERRELYELFAERFAERAPSVVIGYPSRLYVHPAGLGGLDGGLLFSPSSRFRDVHLWDLTR